MQFAKEKVARVAMRRTHTSVPAWARPLTSVVAAFEDRDERALRAALDAAEARRILEGASTGARLDEARERISRIYVPH